MGFFHLRINVDESLCTKCGYCDNFVNCTSSDSCIACKACIDACPRNARYFIEDDLDEKTITCYVNGEKVEVKERQAVLQALRSLGYKETTFTTSDEKTIHAPCKTGGCYSCAVIINNEMKQSCITPIAEGMKIETNITDYEPLRIITGFQGHSVGGVGTPKELVFQRIRGYIEVACFASGCIYRCPTCQNWPTTYLSRAKPKTPFETAKKLTSARRLYNVNRMAISGGESTLNRIWLVEYVKQLKEMNQDSHARIHIDTNAAILTTDYIDELIAVGMTDIGPDLKGMKLETFSKITQVENKKLAKQYLDTSWTAVKYILDNYSDSVFIGVGIPYNKI
ncbi:MAG: radical SAM protein, partial [Asgard group archaeon]|nr:radical SAM protein [Asgard group archaeon]